MKEEEKQRKVHEAVLKMLYPPPPTPPPRHEEKQTSLIEPSNDLPGEELENEEGYSSPSSSGENENEGENGGTGKLTRAQRKRLRKRKLKDDAIGRRKIIGPLLPCSSDDKNDGGVEVVGNGHEGVRQNAATKVSGLGDPASCSKRNKLKRRRKSKSLSGKS